MSTVTSRTISTSMTEHDELASVRHEITQLLWTREIWSAQEAMRYDELTDLELQLMSFCRARS